MSIHQLKSTFYPAVRSVKQQGSAEFYSADILARPTVYTADPNPNPKCPPPNHVPVS